jgi:hypothetical protein
MPCTTCGAGAAWRNKLRMFGQVWRRRPRFRRRLRRRHNVGYRRSRSAALRGPGSRLLFFLPLRTHAIKELGEIAQLLSDLRDMGSPRQFSDLLGDLETMLLTRLRSIAHRHAPRYFYAMHLRAPQRRRAALPWHCGPADCRLLSDQGKELRLPDICVLSQLLSGRS